MRHQVVAFVTAGLLETSERRFHGVTVAPRAHVLNRTRLLAFDFLSNLEQIDVVLLFFFLERVDADNDAVFGFDRTLITIARLGDLFLEESGFDRFDYATI